MMAMRFRGSTDTDPRHLVAAKMTDKRLRTAYRITRAAQRLAVEKGYDDFTLDELAERAEVSRRTLFNYYDSKLEATIGAGPWLDQHDIDVYLAGGPTGESVADLAELVLATLRASAGDEFTREDLRMTRQCFERNPKLLIATADLFQDFIGGLQGLIQQREGIRPDDPRSHLLLAMLASVFEVSLHYFGEGDERELADIYLDNLKIARKLLK
ncbi:TetR/AcrR family transcriptional regulator [Flexivirga sp. ID2601S]|uniref:TetR/AcrR family transcriptional regulator n=1 Tax=Flexivirga aerilata TaxID=1656889 RepID=A0A849ABA6_9MICO|nr:TetR/AcrR family transcriptional regulator [Flexivirga aerilata]NNG38194.1 TetR/AcrR family transcriptional regulator [Flexivirga aerilata]